MYFLFINKALRLNNLKTKTAINSNISVFVIYFEAIIHLSLYNLRHCTFSELFQYSFFRVFYKKQTEAAGAINVSRSCLTCRIGQRLNSNIIKTSKIINSFVINSKV